MMSYTYNVTDPANLNDRAYTENAVKNESVPTDRSGHECTHLIFTISRVNCTADTIHNCRTKGIGKVNTTILSTRRIDLIVICSEIGYCILYTR